MWAFWGWLPWCLMASFIHSFIHSSTDIDCKCAYHVVKSVKMCVGDAFEWGGSIHWGSECKGPSSMHLLPYSQKRPEDHRDVSRSPYLDRSWRIQWSCQNIARSMSDLSGSSPQKQDSRLQTCRLHLKCLGLKDEIIEGTARETKPDAIVTSSSPTEHTHTACSDVIHSCLLPHTGRATLTPPNPGTRSFLPAQTCVESFSLYSSVKEVGDSVCTLPGFSGERRHSIKTQSYSLLRGRVRSGVGWELPLLYTLVGSCTLLMEVLTIRLLKCVLDSRINSAPSST